ncbi:MAG: MerR family transcriptional regulator [Tannerella sp.]|jgi:DNA-binding transcriptional MerR regulator|nr:MerR family transcriptional regulator [Tannerella sp.]
MASKKDKDPKRFYSIKEVAQQFGLSEPTLRFWEKEFEEISPRKTAKGTRYYSKEDIDIIGLIYHLVRERRMTLAGARLKLKENKDLTINQTEISNRLKLIRNELVSLADAIKELDENSNTTH